MHYGESFSLAEELAALVNAIEQQVLPLDPASALELTEAFLRTDDATLGRVDDSAGSVGDVYIDGERLWLRAAASLDAGRLERLLELVAGDSYGTRDVLLPEADTLLSEHELRRLAAHFEEAARRALGQHLQRDGRKRITSSELIAATSSLSLVAEALRDTSGRIPTHAQFVEALHRRYGRKYAFWWRVPALQGRTARVSRRARALVRNEQRLVARVCRGLAERIGNRGAGPGTAAARG